MLTQAILSYKKEKKLPAKKIGPLFGVSAEDTGRLYAHGTRLAYLALCGMWMHIQYIAVFHAEDAIGSPYIFVMVAILGARNNLCRKMPTEHLSSLGLHLRALPGTSLIYCSDLIKTLI